jgi:DNA-binding NtrC family response regulator
MAYLRYKTGPKRGTCHRLVGERAVAGRSEECSIRIEDRAVSRRHAVLRYGDGAWTITDLGSHNCVVVNGQPVHEHTLADGDSLCLGHTQIEFCRGEPPQEPGDMELTRTISLDALARRWTQHGGGAAEQRLAVLVRLAQRAATVEDLPALLHEPTVRLADCLDAARVMVLLRGTVGELAAYEPEAPASVPYDPETHLAEDLVERSEREAFAARLKSSGGCVVACAPVTSAGRAMGLVCARRGPGAEVFDADDVDYLSAVGAQLGAAVDTVRGRCRMAICNESLRRALGTEWSLVGASPAMLRMTRVLTKIAGSDAGVLITGESGTGKELVARTIHGAGERRGGPMEAVNCAALPGPLAESELFGHARGAFTGAVRERAGRFELAHGGTLFLDEVAELSPECQVKLLRAVEAGAVRRLGEQVDRPVDVRIVAATNRDLEAEVERGRFRADLFYRLDRLRIRVPPLRERDGDVKLLVEHFLQDAAAQCKRDVRSISRPARELLEAYDWPGNVRELRNVVERMVMLTDGIKLTVDDVPAELRRAVEQGAAGSASMEAVRKRHVRHVLEQTGGNKKRAAEMLGIDRSTLYAWLDRYELQPSRDAQ